MYKVYQELEFDFSHYEEVLAFIKEHNGHGKWIIEYTEEAEEREACELNQ
jgi:hypothetical protein